jgi:zinc-binding in reverse transcriptase
VSLGARMDLGNGALTRFLHDVWFGEMSISHMYPQLAALATDPSLTVQDAWEARPEIRYQVGFKKPLTHQQQLDWEELQRHIMAFSPHQGHLDTMLSHQWILGYSVRSQYQFLDFEGIKIPRYHSLWKAGLSLKIRAFLWLVFHHRILIKDQLAKKGWVGDVGCIIYDGS